MIVLYHTLISKNYLSHPGNFASSLCNQKEKLLTFHHQFIRDQ